MNQKNTTHYYSDSFHLYFVMLQSYAKITVLVNPHSVQTDNDNAENEFDIFQIHEKEKGV